MSCKEAKVLSGEEREEGGHVSYENLLVMLLSRSEVRPESFPHSKASVEVFRGSAPDFPPLNETVKLDAVIGVSLPNFRESSKEIYGALFEDMALD
eukprot:4489588-Amphidinium_carterae.1